VLVIDTDHVPYAAVICPDFDVVVADEARLLGLAFSTYEDLFGGRSYAARLKEHARHLFNGKLGIKCGSIECGFDEEWACSV